MYPDYPGSSPCGRDEHASLSGSLNHHQDVSCRPSKDDGTITCLHCRLRARSVSCHQLHLTRLPRMGFTRNRLTALTLASLLVITGFYYFNKNGHAVFDNMSRLTQDARPRLTEALGIWTPLAPEHRFEEPPRQPPYGAVVAAGRDGVDLTWMKFPFSNECVDTSDSYLSLKMTDGFEAGRHSRTTSTRLIIQILVSGSQRIKVMRLWFT